MVADCLPGEALNPARTQGTVHHAAAKNKDHLGDGGAVSSRDERGPETTNNSPIPDKKFGHLGFPHSLLICQLFLLFKQSWKDSRHFPHSLRGVHL